MKSLEEQHEAWIVDWFKDHQASLSDPRDSVQRLSWKKPGTTCYAMIFLLSGGYLCVLGDLGEAVYQWSEKVSLRFLADCSLDYFGSKCQASSEEPKGKAWYPERVQRWIGEQLRYWSEEHETLPISLERCYELNPGLDEAIESAGGWADYIYNSDGLILSDVPVQAEPGEFHTEYPIMSFEGSEDWEVGYDWDLRTRAHLRGLQMACKQLEIKAA